MIFLSCLVMFPVKHLFVPDIDVGNAKPIKQHPYRLNPRKREVIKAEVNYHGMAVPSQSP